MNENDYIESIKYSICKKVIERIFPNELKYFDLFWEVMENNIAIKEEHISEQLVYDEYSKSLEKELGLINEPEISDFNTPKIVALINLIWVRLVSVKGQLSDAEIGDTINKYGKELPDWLKMKTRNLIIPLIKEDLNKINKIIGIDIKREQNKYNMYCNDYKAGKAITENEYIAIREYYKSEYIVWMDEKNNDLFVMGKRPENVYPEERRAISCLIKNIGNTVDYKSLYEAIHNIRGVSRWDDRGTELINDVYKCMSSLMKHCHEIREYVFTERGIGYKLDIPSDTKYCLLEKLRIEKAP